MKRILTIFFSLSLFVALANSAHSQSLTSAVSQAMKLPAEITSVAIWPFEMSNGSNAESFDAALSDEIEAAVSRRAAEKKIKAITRRQAQTLLQEIRLTSSEKIDFDKLVKSLGVDAVVLTTGSFSKATCLSVTIKVVGVKSEIQGQILASSKPFKVTASEEGLDMEGCN